jgi:hypothetical protein
VETIASRGMGGDLELKVHAMLRAAVAAETESRPRRAVKQACEEKMLLELAQTDHCSSLIIVAPGDRTKILVQLGIQLSVSLVVEDSRIQIQSENGSH